jgi:hemin uptake protein HemP
MTSTQSKPVEQRGPIPAPKAVTAVQLLGGARELVIVHNGREYRLRITQNGKLILTA